MRPLSLLSLLALCLAPSSLALWPQPVQLTTGDAFVQVAPNLSIDFTHAVDPQRIPHDLKSQIRETTLAIQRNPLEPLEVDRGRSWTEKVVAAPTLARVDITIVQLLKHHPYTCHDKGKKRSQRHFHGRSAAQQAAAEDAESHCSITYWATRTLSTNISGDDVKVDTSKPIPDHLSPRDAEAYELTIPSDGKRAHIRAYTALGALRALKTLQQMVYSLNMEAHSKSHRSFIQNTPVKIADRPAFPYRGLLLDTSRNFFPISSITHMLDGMALVKLNQFHWHITDAQSWPLAFDANSNDDGLDLSLLAKTGAYPGMIYTEADVRHLIAYAAERGINVNLEVDMPAHLKSGVEELGDKKMITCSDEDNWLKVAAEPPSGQLNLRPTNDTTGVSKEIETLTRSVLKRTAALSMSPYLSSGGDEPNLPCWNADNETQIDESIIKPFMEIVTDTLTKVAKKGMVWEEMAIKFPKTASTLANGSIVEAWTTADNVGAILAANPGTLLIHAPSTHFYLDCGHGQWVASPPDYQSWCPFVSWQKTYTFDPYNGTKTEVDRSRILGGESALWTEQIDQFNLQQRAWPRAASAAEVFWTGADYKIETTGKDGKEMTLKRNGTEALQRFLDVRERLISIGIMAEPVQPLWCVLRRGRCNWPAA